MNLNWIEAIGWLASLLTVATYSMRSMIPLRILAIGSSVCFAVYGLVLEVWPLLAMELLLLPINIYRFWQVLSLRRKVTNTTGDGPADFSVIKAYGKREHFAAGSTIFERGDPVDRLYYITRGKVTIPELDIILGPEDMFGEISFFTDAAKRTASVQSLDEVEVYSINENQFMRLQFEDPSFGLSMVRTMTRRLVENMTKNQTETGKALEAT